MKKVVGIGKRGVACWIVEAIMRALPRCRASEGAADIGIYNKREDSLCGCFVAVAVGFDAEWC